ncbi:MAG: hypothetical protein NZV14_11220 [Bryobacteraceae bacterium]|nr:hypothetical protein [Bryobacteraceae bacterium]MDW8378723.1 hypothetical protein [Bryobacterales bacterium]
MIRRWSILTIVLSFSVAWAQRVEVRNAPTLAMPTPVDSNSPAFWLDGQLMILNSAGVALLTSGRDQFYFEGDTEAVEFETSKHQPFWIEAAHLDQAGTLWAWYHHEPRDVCPSGLTAPVIGAMYSTDGGQTFYDLGIVLESGDRVNCSAQNGFFAGGHGDFSVILDREQKYFYFLFTNYAGDPKGQGVAIARMAYEDRHNPVGAVYKYYEGEWNEPGLGGRVTAIFPSRVTWERPDADSFWGPSVHWNTHLQKYVVLLNRACCQPRWPQEGIYISFNDDVSDPLGWQQPRRILAGNEIGYAPGYYPQVLGTQYGETDTLASAVARLYIHGISNWELVFYPQ